MQHLCAAAPVRQGYCRNSAVSLRVGRLPAMLPALLAGARRCGCCSGAARNCRVCSGNCPRRRLAYPAWPQLLLVRSANRGNPQWRVPVPCSRGGGGTGESDSLCPFEYLVQGGIGADCSAKLDLFLGGFAYGQHFQHESDLTATKRVVAVDGQCLVVESGDDEVPRLTPFVFHGDGHADLPIFLRDILYAVGEYQ